MSADHDMSGFWTGEYRYSSEPLVVRFSASIRESEGQLTGSILEPNTFILNDSGEAEAAIDGERIGLAVTFTKIYTQPVNLPQPPLIYQGAANSTFTLIVGTWRFSERGYAGGNFTMSRVATGRAGARIIAAEGLPHSGG